MDRVVVVGNCQAGALEVMLASSASFAGRFELARFPAVHEIPDEMVSELHRAVEGAAVCVLQRVDDGYRDGIGLGTETLARMAGGATVIRWPSVYWPGYVPNLFYLRAANGGPVTDGPFDYHDRTILDAYAAGLDASATLAQMSDPDRPSEALALAEAATAELAFRGEGCDVDVAPFIAERFRDELLFFTMNHPANRTLRFVADEVLRLLGLPGRADPAAFPFEMLGTTFYPLHANHARALGLRFATGDVGAEPFRIRGETYAPADAVAMFYAYYEAHPELVALNVEPADAA